MPEGPEVDTDKLHEAIHERLHEEGGHFLRRIALTTAVLAAFAAVDAGSLPCRPCDQRVCTPGDFRCLRGLTPDAVKAAADRALARAHRRHRRAVPVEPLVDLPRALAPQQHPVGALGPLIEVRDGRVTLTRSGRLMANEVAIRLR